MEHHMLRVKKLDYYFIVYISTVQNVYTITSFSKLTK